MYISLIAKDIESFELLDIFSYENSGSEEQVHIKFVE